MRTVLLTVIFALIVTSAGAFEIRSGQSVTIPQGTTIDDDLLSSGNSIDLTGAVTGNVMVAGNTVTVSGPVSGMLAAAGNTVTVGGAQKTVMAAGSVTQAKSLTALNAAFAGSNVIIDEGSKITRDLMAAGSNVDVRGSVGRDVKIGGANVILGGTVGRDANISGANITIEPNTTIRGNLIYESVNDARIDKSAKILGRVEHRVPKHERRGPSGAGRALGAFLGFLMMLAFGSLFAALFPLWTSSAADRIITAPGWSVLWGLIVLIVAPIAAFIAMLTVIGLPIGAAILLAYIFAILLSMPVSAIALGRIIIRDRSIWLQLLLGLVIIFVLGAIPYLGGLVRLAVLLFGLGAIWTNILPRRGQPEQAAVTPRE